MRLDVEPQLRGPAREGRKNPPHEPGHGRGRRGHGPRDRRAEAPLTMGAFTTLTARAAPLDLVNVDTDRIIPARFLRRPRAEGYGQFLFHDLREADAAFPLDRPEYAGARILVAAENFGCGSSREGAVWALMGAGF